MKRLQHKIGLGETTLPDELKRTTVREPAGVLVGAAAAADPSSEPTGEAPTTRFSTAKSAESRDIGSWLGELRGKVRQRPTPVETADESTAAAPPPAPIEDAPTTAIPTRGSQAPAPQQLSAEETRAIPISRPDSGDSDVATEQLNARAKSGGGVSAQDLLRREGRL
jgi:RND superfamily putative drug exporter